MSCSAPDTEPNLDSASHQPLVVFLFPSVKTFKKSVDILRVVQRVALQLLQAEAICGFNENWAFKEKDRGRPPHAAYGEGFLNARRIKMKRQPEQK